MSSREGYDSAVTTSKGVMERPDVRSGVGREAAAALRRALKTPP